MQSWTTLCAEGLRSTHATALILWNLTRESSSIDMWKDASTPQGASRFAKAAVSASGPPSDLIITAGLVSGMSIEDATEAGVRDIINNNLGVAIYCMQQFFLSCDQSRATAKSIVVVGSNAASEARPSQPIYAASKAAVGALSRERGGRLG